MYTTFVFRVYSRQIFRVQSTLACTLLLMGAVHGYQRPVGVSLNTLCTDTLASLATAFSCTTFSFGQFFMHFGALEATIEDWLA